MSKTKVGDSALKILRRGQLAYIGDPGLLHEIYEGAFGKSDAPASTILRRTLNGLRKDKRFRKFYICCIWPSNKERRHVAFQKRTKECDNKK